MSEVKFKDVAHLYLGCRLQIGNGAFVDLHTKRLDVILYGKSPLEYKPILRPLDSITEEEAKEIGKKLESGFWSIWHDAVVFGEGWDNTNFSALEYVELLSRGFDLFGLISSGQAISKNDKG